MCESKETGAYSSVFALVSIFSSTTVLKVSNPRQRSSPDLIQNASEMYFYRLITYQIFVLKMKELSETLLKSE